MDFFTKYGWIILVVILAIAVCSYGIYMLVSYIKDGQISKIKEWLLYAVTEAEKALGSGTGQIKLRYVYDMFTTKFSLISKFLSFSTFSELVDEVLEKFRELLSSNENLQKYVDNNGSENK